MPSLPELSAGDSPYGKGPFVLDTQRAALPPVLVTRGNGGGDGYRGVKISLWRDPRVRRRKPHHELHTPSCKDIKAMATHNVTAFLLEMVATFSCRAW